VVFTLTFARAALQERNTGGAITAVAATIMVGTGATTMVGGIIAIGGNL
jgi:hypothetical protein